MGLKSNWKPYIFGSGNRVRISLASLKPSCDQGEDMLWVWAQSNRYSHCLVFKPHTYITIDGWGCAPLNYPSTLYSSNTLLTVLTVLMTRPTICIDPKVLIHTYRIELPNVQNVLRRNAFPHSWSLIINNLLFNQK